MPAWLAGLGMALSSLLVVLTAARLARGLPVLPALAGVDAGADAGMDAEALAAGKAQQAPLPLPNLPKTTLEPV